MSSDLFIRWAEPSENRAAMILASRPDLVNNKQLCILGAQHQCRLSSQAAHAHCADIRWDTGQQCAACFNQCEHAGECEVPRGEKSETDCLQFA